MAWVIDSCLKIESTSNMKVTFIKNSSSAGNEKLGLGVLGLEEKYGTEDVYS